MVWPCGSRPEVDPSPSVIIDPIGPNFGVEPLLETVADSPELATFVGEQTNIVWPAQWDLRRIPVHGPTPVYPHSLIWRRDNPHPGLAALRDYLIAPETGHRDAEAADTWTPAWASRRG